MVVKSAKFVHKSINDILAHCFKLLTFDFRLIAHDYTDNLHYLNALFIIKISTVIFLNS